MARAKKTKEEEKRELAPVRRRGPLSVFDEMERMFDRMMGRPFWPEWPRLRWRGEGLELPFPDVDLYEQDNTVVVKAEIPGVKKEELSVDITEDSVTISGEKKQEEKVEDKDYYRHECSYGSFTRTVAIPPGVDSGRAKASFRDGVLEVKIPKKEEAKKKKIAIE